MRTLLEIYASRLTWQALLSLPHAAPQSEQGMAFSRIEDWPAFGGLICCQDALFLGEQSLSSWVFLTSALQD